MKKIVKCVECGRVQEQKAKNMCGACYQRSRYKTLEIGICKNCGRQRTLYAHGECKPCRDQVYRRRRTG